MNRTMKRISVFTLSAIAVAIGATGAAGLAGNSAVATAEVTEIDPIAKYEFKDSENFGKDSMGNYDMSYRNQWVSGATGELWDKGTLIEGGGVEFSGEFCISQDKDNNIFADVTAFTLAFELKTTGNAEWQHYLGVADHATNNYFAIVGRAGSSGSGEASQAILNAAGTGAGTYWDGAWLSNANNWGDAENEFQHVIISAQPGGTLNVYVNGSAFKLNNKLPATLEADWSPYDADVPFSIGARFNGAADRPSKGAVKNVVFYDFAMDDKCAEAYYQNGYVTPDDVSNLTTVTELSVTADSFENGATKTTLNEAMTLDDMLAQMNTASAKVSLSDETTVSAPVTWTKVVFSGGKYYAVGTAKTSALGYANVYGNEVRYELTVAEIKAVGEPVFLDDEIISGELRDNMTEEEMLALINTATVEITLGDDTVQTVEITFERIEAKMGVYTAYAEVMFNGSSVGTVSVILTVTETNEGTMQELLPVAKWEFEDSSDIGKDTMGNYDLGPVAYEGGDLGNPRDMGTIIDGMLYLNGEEMIACTALNDIGDNLNNGFTLNFQYMQDGVKEGWSAPVSFGFNDWSVSTTCRFLIAANTTQLRVGAHGGVACSSDGNTYWGPIVLADGSDKMHNVTLSVRPGDKFNVYVDGVLAYSTDCPAGWNPSHSNMEFAIGGECVWGNGYDMFKGYIDNVSIYNFAFSLEQSNAYWEKGKIVVGDMNGEIITSISDTPVFENGEVTNGKLTDRLTDTQAVRRINAATVNALFDNGDAVSLNVTWQRLEQQGDKWYIVGSVDTGDIGYATLLTGAQTIKQEVSVERVARTVTVAGTVNGTVSADKEEAYLGDTVTVTLTPDEGYTGDTVTVNGIALMANEDGTYSFVVEGIEDIEISATFKTVTNGGGDVGREEGGGSANVLAVTLGVVGGVVVIAAAVTAVILVRKKKNGK